MSSSCKFDPGMDIVADFALAAGLDATAFWTSVESAGVSGAGGETTSRSKPL